MYLFSHMLPSWLYSRNCHLVGFLSFLLIDQSASMIYTTMSVSGVDIYINCMQLLVSVCVSFIQSIIQSTEPKKNKLEYVYVYVCVYLIVCTCVSIHINVCTQNSPNGVMLCYPKNDCYVVHHLILPIIILYRIVLLPRRSIQPKS